MKKVLLALGVLIGSLGLYGLADAAQTVTGTTVLKSGQSLERDLFRHQARHHTGVGQDRHGHLFGHDHSDFTASTGRPTPDRSAVENVGGQLHQPVYSTSDAEGTYNTDPDDG